jgi:hypothetical protein
MARLFGDWGESVKGRELLHANELDWTRLLDVEARLGAEIVAAEEAARVRVSAARAVAAVAAPDPQALAELSAAREQAAIAQQRNALARIAAQAGSAVRALSGAPDSLIDALARRALDAVLTDTLAAQRR